MACQKGCAEFLEAAAIGKTGELVVQRQATARLFGDLLALERPTQASGLLDGESRQAEAGEEAGDENGLGAPALQAAPYVAGDGEQEKPQRRAGNGKRLKVIATGRSIGLLHVIPVIAHGAFQSIRGLDLTTIKWR